MALPTDTPVTTFEGSLRELLAHGGVSETCELRSGFGLMAFHGGNLERTTDVIAAEVAERTGSSLYTVVQRSPLRFHLASTAMQPEDSTLLSRFLRHVHTVIAVHGYGRENEFWRVLLGGQNRALAHHLSGYLRRSLPSKFGIVDKISEIPPGLEGLHPANPVNLPERAGVQLELPPTLRWNREARNWSDHEGTPRATQVSSLINCLVEAVNDWRLAA